jgi:hypothetical protein
VNKVWDIDPAVGGPLVRDRLWFWASVRGQDTEQTLAGIYFNLTPTGHAYTPDLSRPALSTEQNQNVSVRVTWQVSAKNKINLQQQNGGQQRPYYGYSLGQLTSAPEAIYQSKSIPMYQSQGTWNSPVTSKLLLEGGVLTTKRTTDGSAAGHRTRSPIRLWHSFSWGTTATLTATTSARINMRFAASYVTGSHAFKTATFMRRGADRRQRRQQRPD